MSALPIYTCQAAPAELAGYLRRLLQPVVEACRFDHWLPVEIRPTGRWSGWCASRDGAPDRRVSLTTKIVFYPTESILALYIHESGHRLLEHAEVLDHGPEFFCLNAALLLRCASFFRLNPIFNLSFYELQDCPAELESEPAWRGLALNWALPLAAELAASDAGAEALAEIVCERWQKFLQERENARVQAAQQVLAARKNAAAQKEQIEALQSSLFVARTFLFVGWFCFLSVCIFVF